jgi:hypothetical protein
VFKRVRRIFPGLTGWSSAEIPTGSAANVRRLATSTLALDVAGVDAHLPQAAAECATPCIAPARTRLQARLWPSLTITPSDTRQATVLGRRMLADHCEAADVCSRARKLSRTFGSSE